MTHDQLKYALALQNFKNFSKAAESCLISQPSLSVQIAKLEEELGVKLFLRTRAGITVTNEGEEILRQARLILDETSRLTQMATDLKGEVQGKFRLGIIPTLASALLPFFLGGFQRRFPKVQLSIYEEPTEHLIGKIGNGTLDGAILSTPAKCPDSFMEKVLFYEPFVIFGSDEHPILKNKRVSPQSLAADEILLLDDAHCLRDQVLQLCRSRQEISDTRIQIRSGSLQTLIELIRIERNFTLLPVLSMRFLTKEERATNIRPFSAPIPSRKVSLLFDKSRLKRSIIDGIASQILESLPKETIAPGSGGSVSSQVRVVSPNPDHFKMK